MLRPCSENNSDTSIGKEALVKKRGGRKGERGEEAERERGRGGSGRERERERERNL